MKVPTCTALAAIVVTIALSPADVSAASTLSPKAQLIFEEIKKRGDPNVICKDREVMVSTVRNATRSLVSEGQLSGRPREEAREAASYLMENCGKL